MDHRLIVVIVVAGIGLVELIGLALVYRYTDWGR